MHFFARCVPAVRLKLLALLICGMLVAGTIGYFFLIPRNMTELGLRVSLVTSVVPTEFPTEINVSSTIENTKADLIRLDIAQTTPIGFNTVDAYVVNAEGSRLSYNFSEASNGSWYSLISPFPSGERISVTVLLEMTSTSVPGNFTTKVRGMSGDKIVQSQATSWIEVAPPQSTCTDGDTLKFGDFILLNNVESNLPPNEPHRQCIFLNPESFGWNSSRPSPSVIPFFYPEIIYGKNPWRSSSTTSRLPVP